VSPADCCTKPLSLCGPGVAGAVWTVFVLETPDSAAEAGLGAGCCSAGSAPLSPCLALQLEGQRRTRPKLPIPRPWSLSWWSSDFSLELDRCLPEESAVADNLGLSARFVVGQAEGSVWLGPPGRQLSAVRAR